MLASNLPKVNDRPVRCALRSRARALRHGLLRDAQQRGDRIRRRRCRPHRLGRWRRAYSSRKRDTLGDFGGGGIRSQGRCSPRVGG